MNAISIAMSLELGKEHCPHDQRLKDRILGKTKEVYDALCKFATNDALKKQVGIWARLEYRQQWTAATVEDVDPSSSMQRHKFYFEAKVRSLEAIWKRSCFRPRFLDEDVCSDLEGNPIEHSEGRERTAEDQKRHRPWTQRT